MAKSSKNALSKDFSSMVKAYHKSTGIEKVLYVILVLLIVTMLVNYLYPAREGFTETKEFVTKQGPAVYDDFYANIYDNLVYSKIKNVFEVTTIVNTTRPTNRSIILDIGSGTGHHVKAFADKKIKAIGIDLSAAMVAKANKNFPNLDYRQQDAMDKMAFPGSSFTHITCLYFTIYYMKNKKLFFSNCYHWLKPGGYIVLHLVNKQEFDPIMPAGDPFILLSPQKYSKKRITSTVVKFVGYDYKSNFEIYPNDTTAVFREQLKSVNDGKIRKHTHFLYMPTQKKILNMAKDAGFILLAQIDMKECKYDSQYLYILQKPN